jgi:hypothetical protein
VTQPQSDGISLGFYVRSKFDDLVNIRILRNILGQQRSTIDLAEIMDKGKILLINLGSTAGGLSPRQNRVLGMLLLARIFTTVKERPKSRRRPFHLYVDEFQTMATRTFGEMLSEARKFGVSLILANQFVSQIDDPGIMNAVLGNVGTLAAFRVGVQDAQLLEKEFIGIRAHDLVNLPNWVAYVRTQNQNMTLAPFNLHTVVPDHRPDSTAKQDLLKKARERYGRPRREVEAEIRASLQPPPSEEEQSMMGLFR